MDKIGLLSIREACKYLGISRATLLKSEENELISPSRTVGGHRRYSRKDLNRLIRATTGPRQVTREGVRGEDGRIVLPKIIERLASYPAPIDDAMQSVLRDIVKLLQADAGFIALFSDQDIYNLRVVFDPYSLLSDNSERILAEGSISDRVMILQQALTYHHSEADIAIEGLTQGVCAPLVYQGVSLGVIHIQSLSRHQFLSSELEFLSLIALYLSSLIVNSQLLLNSTHLGEEMSCLNRLGQTLQKQHCLDAMAVTLLAEVVRISNAKAGCILLDSDGGTPHFITAKGDWFDLEPKSAGDFATVARKTLVSDKSCTVLNYPQYHTLGLDSSPILRNMRSIVILPMHSQSERLGLLFLGDHHERNDNGWGLRFLSIICAQAAQLIQKEILFQRLTLTEKNERLLRNYYERMVSVSPIGMEVIDRNNKIVSWNEAIVRMTGITQQEALGADKFRLQPWLLKHNGPAILGEVFENRQILRLQDFPYERRGGGILRLDLTFLPFTDENDEITAVIVYVEDNTELRALRLANREITRMPSLP